MFFYLDYCVFCLFCCSHRAHRNLPCPSSLCYWIRVPGSLGLVREWIQEQTQRRWSENRLALLEKSKSTLETLRVIRLKSEQLPLQCLEFKFLLGLDSCVINPSHRGVFFPAWSNQLSWCIDGCRFWLHLIYIFKV
jgi:hypothetical protein